MDFTLPQLQAHLRECRDRYDRQRERLSSLRERRQNILELLQKQDEELSQKRSEKATLKEKLAELEKEAGDLVETRETLAHQRRSVQNMADPEKHILELLRPATEISLSSQMSCPRERRIAEIMSVQPEPRRRNVATSGGDDTDRRRSRRGVGFRWQRGGLGQP